MSRPLTVMLVAAEPSGDSLGAGLAAALKERLGDSVRLIGVGGPKMAAAGIESPFDISQLSVLGLVEGLKAYPRVLARLKDTVALARREKPDMAVLIDSWGFNIRLAKALRKADPRIKLIKYVGPQVWAYRPGRAKVLAAAVDHLLTIHAFDAPLFEKVGLATTFVGNPSLAKDFSKADPERLRQALGLADGQQILLVLPGSRRGEIERMSEPLGDAVKRLKVDRPDLAVVIPVAPAVAALVREKTMGWPGVQLVEDEGLKDDAFTAATFALACSGTVTTELALAGCPMAVGYRLGKITHAILDRLLLTEWVVLLNIAAKRFVAPELIQDECTGEALAREAALRLDDELLRQAQIADQNAALVLMGKGGPDPAVAAAQAVIRLASLSAHPD